MKRNRFGLLELHSAVFLFGLAGLFGKWLNLPPMAIVFGRTALASLALAAVLMIMRQPVARHWRAIPGWLVLSGAVLAFHWATFFHSIQVSTVAVGVLTFSTFPLFVTFLEPLFFKERRRWLDLATAALVLAGLALIVPTFDFGNTLTRGAFWGTMSGFLFAVLSLLNRRLVAAHPPMVLAAGQNLVAALVLLPFVFRRTPWPGARDIVLLGVLGVVCTALAHALFIKSLSHVRAQLASVVAGLESVYGILFAFLLLGEVPAVRTLVGGAVILSAVVLATLKRHESSGAFRHAGSPERTNPEGKRKSQT